MKPKRKWRTPGKRNHRGMQNKAAVPETPPVVQPKKAGAQNEITSEKPANASARKQSGETRTVELPPVLRPQTTKTPISIRSKIRAFGGTEKDWQLAELEAKVEAISAGLSRGQEGGVPTETLPTRVLEDGRFCDRVIEEIKKIRHFYSAHSVNQVKIDHPDFIVWKVIEEGVFAPEDLEIFYHPNRWGPTVGYALNLLSKHFDGRSVATIRRWRKVYRRFAREARNQQRTRS